MKKNIKNQKMNFAITIKYNLKRYSENREDEKLLPNNNKWKSLFDSLVLFSSDFMNQRIQPGLEKRENLFSRNIDSDK